MKKKDSLKINQNKDGSYTAEWDKQDPEWSWMNNLTSKEVQEVIEKAVQLEAKRITNTNKVIFLIILIIG